MLLEALKLEASVSTAYYNPKENEHKTFALRETIVHFSRNIVSSKPVIELRSLKAKQANEWKQFIASVKCDLVRRSVDKEQ